jgi:hypothetical protein
MTKTLTRFTKTGRRVHPLSLLRARTHAAVPKKYLLTHSLTDSPFADEATRRVEESD